MRSPESSFDMRKSELSPEVRGYIENLTAQIEAIPGELQFKGLQEMLDAIDQNNSATFEQDPVRREKIMQAAETLEKLVERRRKTKESGKLPRPEIGEPFDPGNWEPEDFGPEKFLKEHQERIEKKEGMDLLSLQIGGEDKKELFEHFSIKIKIDNSALTILNGKLFVPLTHEEEHVFVLLTVKDLQITQKVTTAALYARVAELGLKPCHPETGVRYIQAGGKVVGDRKVFIGMEPIMSNGFPTIFSTECFWDDDHLNSAIAPPERVWSDTNQFLFRVPKKYDISRTKP